MTTLKHYDEFVNRHIGPREDETAEMLKTLNVSSLDELIGQTIPDHIRLKEPLKLSEPMSEYAFLNYIRELASKNHIAKSYIGMGYYPAILPPVILRNIFENPAWYTQYTPYQAEIAQGRLEALINFQTAVADLTGLPLANASLLDEGTAAAEAMLMFLGSTKKKGALRFFVDEHTFPQTIAVLHTRALPKGIELVIGDFQTFTPDDSYFGAFVQYPDNSGSINSIQAKIAACNATKTFVCVASDLLALALITPPGEFGADVVVGNSQRFGVPMGFGGPHAGFFAAKEEFARMIPGRIIGASVDVKGAPAYRMALQTREQHIKREKATSNICTAQVLLAILAGMYAVYHGQEGIRKIALFVHSLTRSLDSMLQALGLLQLNKEYFDTLRITCDSVTSAKIRSAAEPKRMNFRYFENGDIGISLSEVHTESDVAEIVALFAEVLGKTAITPSFMVSEPAQNLKRTSAYLTHPVFQMYHSETDLMRYIKSLERKDLSLVHSMIALGSCTMKLNAAAEMLAVTYPRFAHIHPFAPAHQTEGYLTLIKDLEDALSEITGFAGVSMQPNSGAQGEYAGLMVIREYQLRRGETNRTVCLIPSSAHGTNPASAVMAGMKVVVVACDEMGNIDMHDLRKKAEEHKDTLCALMVTYPSTHGVYEESIIEVCEIIHQYGGQVYMDGANMNAQVGLTSPGMIGADVCHLNLHKTFAIPHGGGGPGMGPICVREHLVPFLPTHPVVKVGGEQGFSAVSAAPYGSANVLIISLAYIKMLGESGLTRSTKYAILNANYMKEKLSPHYKTLYTNKNGRNAHEMIFDMREFKKTAGIEVEDIAKRLMDYGFHAPTVSFPVPGTLMVEPTESEPKAELDRFIDTMIAIRAEIREIEEGHADKEDNVLKNAPHTLETVIADDWKHSYTREKAAYPLPLLRKNKFWPSVSRINNAYGDRNLMCTCLPIEEYIV